VGASSSPQRYRLEQWLDNPRCDKNMASAILNVPMIEVAINLAEEAQQQGKDFAKIKPLDFPQFAREIGDKFEDSLFEGDEPLLVQRLLEENELIATGQEIHLITRDTALTSEEHLEESHKVLKRIAKSTSGKTWVIRGFKLPAEVMPPDSTFEIDILVALPIEEGGYRLLVGEVKVYPDRGGRTDSVQIAGARSQAGLYVHILRNWLPGLEDVSGIVVDGNGFLIFAEPAKGIPKFAALENLNDQDRRAAVAISGIQNLFARNDLVTLATSNKSEEKLEFVKSQKDEYRESCWGHCAMAEVCFRKALEEDRTIVLGQKTEQQLSSLTLSRAVALADGDVEPMNDVEFDLVERFADARYPEIEDLKWKL
jgi:hypothetical protein